MNILLTILGFTFIYIVIQLAIDKSINTKIQKENNKLLKDIKKLLEDMQK